MTETQAAKTTLASGVLRVLDRGPIQLVPLSLMMGLEPAVESPENRSSRTRHGKRAGLGVQSAVVYFRRFHFQ